MWTLRLIFFFGCNFVGTPFLGLQVSNPSRVVSLIWTCIRSRDNGLPSFIFSTSISFVATNIRIRNASKLAWRWHGKYNHFQLTRRLLVWQEEKTSLSEDPSDGPTSAVFVPISGVHMSRTNSSASIICRAWKNATVVSDGEVGSFFFAQCY